MESITNDSVEQKPIATPKLAAALCKFQMEYSNAVRDASGNFGSYVSLSEAEYAVSPATKFGLSLVKLEIIKLANLSFKYQLLNHQRVKKKYLRKHLHNCVLN
jgi:hypothetical protein